MFFGRTHELRALEQLYESEHFEFAVVYGRRRVGKTALLNEFIREKKAIYFTGVESSSAQNLENLSRCIMEYISDLSWAVTFPSFEKALDTVFRLALEDRLILVIDEYPYVARACASLASTLQQLIDRYKDSSRLMLILCGSSMSYMEDHVLAYKAPLYGRRTAQFKILPFDFADASNCFCNFSNEDMALIYGITGGTPQYLLQMKDSLSVEENVRRTFLNPNSFLFEEPENLMKQEMREPALYNALITTIAGGAVRLSEISTKSGVPGSLCSSHLKSLISLGLIQKETPYGEKNSKKSIYKITDNMFRFWYRFIPANQSVIARGASDVAWNYIKPQLPDYMGSIFEDICKEYLWQLLLKGNCPIQFREIGRWWGTNPVSRKQAEIDIMGEQDKNTALFAECKWTNAKADAAILQTLEDRSRIFHYQNVHLFLFSKSGFTKECQEAARAAGNVSLVTLEEIMVLLKDNR